MILTARMIPSHLAPLALAGYSPRTIRARKQTLTAFTAFVAPRTLLEADRSDIETFLARDLAPESRRAYRGHLAAFYRWAVTEEHLDADPCLKVPAIRVPRTLPNPITDEQLALALAHAGARLRAWLLLMALAGLRCMEVAALEPQDLIEVQGIPVLRLRVCKGGGISSVPAHPEVVKALRNLPTRDGVWWTCGSQNVTNIVGDHLRAVGINATAHKLRHYAGTAWYTASGYDLLATADLLRHANVSTVQRYAQLVPNRTAQVVDLVRLPTRLDVA